MVSHQRQPKHSLRHYVVLASPLPTQKKKSPPIYRMRIFAPNKVVAKSRTWYFLSTLCKLKKANGRIVGIHEVHERVKNVKNFGIFLRYVSRSGVHNMYKEYRATTLVGAVEQMYAEMASRHRARFSNIHIIKTLELTESPKRADVAQFSKEGIKFPVFSRIYQSKEKKYKRIVFSASRPKTFVH